ncbi:MAG: hypothetical protein E4H03_04065 [Myxococcales bacterium]|nr:MAG: hypothetical protein E4H03_04065 [Myxococcales bacterium]
MQQVGRNRHDHICESIELFAREFLADHEAEEAKREAAKAERLAPHIEAALARKQRARPLADEEIPVVRASVKKAKIPQTHDSAFSADKNN